MGNLAPVRLPEGLTVESMLYGPPRSGMPTLLGASGRLQNGDRAVYVAFEWPETYPVRSKIGREEVHVRRFIRDCQQVAGAAPFAGFKRGGREDEFPDFYSWDEEGGSRTALECTQLVVSQRLAAIAQFESVRMAVRNAARERFAHLAGHVAYVSFDDVLEIEREPPDRANRATDVIEALTEYRPPAESPSAAPPDQIDPDTVLKFPGGQLTAAPLGPNYRTFFQSVVGFELALNFPTEITGKAAWKLFLERVREKDLADGAHSLLVTASGPTVSGLAFPSDSVLAHVVVEAAANEILQAERLQRLWIHDWANECVYLLRPGIRGVELVCGDPPQL